MKKFKLILLVSILILVAFGTLSYLSAFQTYSNSQYRFSFEYPEEWSVFSPEEALQATGGRLNPSKNMVVIVANPKDWDQNVNVNVIIGAAPGRSVHDYELENLIRMSDRQLSSALPGFKKISAKIITIKDIRGLEYIYEFKRFNLPMQQKQVTLIGKDRSYVITFTSKKSDFVNANQFCFSKIIASFKAW